MRAVALAILCAALGCGKGLAELEPFACAKDQSCPSGYLCLGNVCDPLQTCDPVNSACSGARPRCTAPDGCFAGTLCYNDRSYGGAQGTLNHCRKLCHAEGDCSPPGTHCALGLSGPQFSALTGGTLGVCEPSCDFNGNLCPLNQHCDTIPGESAGIGILTCRDDGLVAEGGNCFSANCKAGLLCIPGIAPFQSVPTCRVWCDNTSHLCATGTCEVNSYRINGSTGFCH